MNNKLIVCDVDGVILNFSRGMKEHTFKNYGVYLSEDPMDWGWNNDLIGFYLRSFWASDDFARIPAYTDVTHLIKSVPDHNRGIDLVFLTDVPEYAFEKRLSNMAEIGFGEFQIKIASDKAAVIESLMPEYKSIMLIDDKVSNVLATLDLYGVKVAYPIRGYNWDALKNTRAIPYYTPGALFLTIVEWGR